MKTGQIISGLMAVMLMGFTPQAFARTMTDNSKVIVNGVINLDAIDKDHDGALSAAELQATEEFKKADFKEMDKNNNGSIDGEELSIWARDNGKGNAVGSSRGYSVKLPPGTVLKPLAPLEPVPPVPK